MLMLNYVLADMLRHMLVMRCKLLFLLFYEHFMRWNGNWLIDCVFCFVFTHLRNLCATWWGSGWGWLRSLCEVMGKGVGLTAVFVCELMGKGVGLTALFVCELMGKGWGWLLSVGSQVELSPSVMFTRVCVCIKVFDKAGKANVYLPNKQTCRNQLSTFIYTWLDILSLLFTHSMKGSNSCCSHTPWRGATRVHTLHAHNFQSAVPSQLDEQLLGTSYQLQWSVLGGFRYRDDKSTAHQITVQDGNVTDGSFAPWPEEESCSQVQEKRNLHHTAWWERKGKKRKKVKRTNHSM